MDKLIRKHGLGSSREVLAAAADEGQPDPTLMPLPPDDDELDAVEQGQAPGSGRQSQQSNRSRHSMQSHHSRKSNPSRQSQHPDEEENQPAACTVLTVATNGGAGDSSVIAGDYDDPDSADEGSDDEKRRKESAMGKIVGTLQVIKGWVTRGGEEQTKRADSFLERLAMAGPQMEDRLHS